MKALKSKLGMWLAAIYLLFVAVVCTPLLLDRAIHHGNGIPFLGAVVLTSPLSWLMLRFLDSVTHADAYVTGGPYYLYMGGIAGCALANALALYRLTKFITRRKQ
jgi:hypothetical protein